jgi:O-antigen/teichoic acid export membrane protein
VGHEEAARATTGERVLSGGAWTALTLLLPQVNTLVTSVVAARFLGPTTMGRQSYIAFAEAALIVIVAGGLPIALARYVAEMLGSGKRTGVRSLVRWVFRLQMVGATLGGGVLVAIALQGARPRAAWLLAGVCVALSSLQSVPSAVLMGLQRWRTASVVGLTTGVVGTAATIGVLAAGTGIVGMFAVEVGISALNLAWTGLLARHGLDEEAPTPGSCGDLLRMTMTYAAYTTATSVLALVVWRRSEFFFLERYSSDAEIAMYSIAFSTVSALGQIPQAAALVFAPAIATLLGAQEHDRISAAFGRGLRLLATVSLPVACGAIALGPAVLRLAYGDNYIGAGPVLRVLMAAYPAVPLLAMAGALLHGLGVVRVVVATDLLAAIINIALDVALIPTLGATGAAMANGGAQLTSAALVFTYATRRVGKVDWQLRHLLGATVASVSGALIAMAVQVIVPGLFGLVLAVAVGASVLCALAVPLRAVAAADAEWLRCASGTKFGGLVGRAMAPFAQRR